MIFLIETYQLLQNMYVLHIKLHIYFKSHYFRSVTDDLDQEEKSTQTSDTLSAKGT